MCDIYFGYMTDEGFLLVFSLRNCMYLYDGRVWRWVHMIIYFMFDDLKDG